jgi:hypothetical protein
MEFNEGVLWIAVVLALLSVLGGILPFVLDQAMQRDDVGRLLVAYDAKIAAGETVSEQDIELLMRNLSIAKYADSAADRKRLISRIVGSPTLDHDTVINSSNAIQNEGFGENVFERVAEHLDLMGMTLRGDIDDVTLFLDTAMTRRMSNTMDSVTSLVDLLEKVAEAQRRIGSEVQIPSALRTGGLAEIGDVILFKDLDTGRRSIYTLAKPPTSREDQLSVESPVGQAIHHQRSGAIIEVSTQSGSTRRFKIESIQKS